MKRSEMLFIIKVALNATKEDSLDEQAENVLDHIEAHNMLYCELMELGKIGSLWAPKGWENE